MRRFPRSIRGATCWRRKPGRRIVEMVRDDVKMSQILTRKAFENAIRVNAAIGGSTNAVLHLLALAGRVGVKLELDDFDRLGHALPLLVDLMPSGKFLMEDFYYAGGVPAVVRALGDLIHRDALTVNGKTMGENTADAPCWNAEVIHSRDNPIREHAGIAVLRGNLAPGRRAGQAFRGESSSAQASRAGRRVYRHRRFQEAGRRSCARHRRELGDGSAGRRAEGLSGDAGSGEHAHAEEACWNAESRIWCGFPMRA